MALSEEVHHVEHRRDAPFRLKQGSYYSFESRTSSSERTSNACQGSGNQKSTSRGNSSAYQGSRFFSSGKARSSSKSTVSTPMRGWLFGGSDISPGSDASPALVLSGFSQEKGDEYKNLSR